MIFLMEVLKEDQHQAVEPQFLQRAHESGVTIRVGLMNKTEQSGVIRDIGRYEVNIDENGTLVTVLKHEISSLSAPHPLLTFSTPAPVPPSPEQPEPVPDTAAGPATRPNIQQEFLDKAIREGQVLTIHLINGLRIRARLASYDSFTLLLEEGGRQHLYYKHAITTINR